MTQIVLPPLPFTVDALSPVISAATLETHHGKHHAAYVKKVNELIAGTPHEGKSLEDVVRDSAKDPSAKTLFNNAAQAWNHARYWESLSPPGVTPAAALSSGFASRIDTDFGSLAGLHEALVKSGTAHFGSGWVWLVWKGGKLDVIDTHDAGTPLTADAPLLLTIDVWEHAYYLDYKNERPKHLAALIERALNWAGASARFDELTRQSSM